MRRNMGHNTELSFARSSSRSSLSSPRIDRASERTPLLMFRQPEPLQNPLPESTHFEVPPGVDVCADAESLSNYYFPPLPELQRPDIPAFDSVPKNKSKLKQYIITGALLIGLIVGLALLIAINIALGFIAILSSTVLTGLAVLGGVARFAYIKLTTPKRTQVSAVDALFGEQVRICIKPNRGFVRQDRTTEPQLDDMCSDSEIEPSRVRASASEIEVMELRKKLFNDFWEFNQALYNLKNFASMPVDDRLIKMYEEGRNLHKEFSDTFLNGNDNEPNDADSLLDWLNKIKQETTKYKQAISSQQRPALRFRI